MWHAKYDIKQIKQMTSCGKRQNAQRMTASTKEIVWICSFSRVFLASFVDLVKCVNYMIAIDIFAIFFRLLLQHADIIEIMRFEIPSL